MEPGFDLNVDWSRTLIFVDSSSFTELPHTDPLTPIGGGGGPAGSETPILDPPQTELLRAGIIEGPAEDSICLCFVEGAGTGVGSSRLSPSVCNAFSCREALKGKDRYCGGSLLPLIPPNQEPMPVMSLATPFPGGVISGSSTKSSLIAVPLARLGGVVKVSSSSYCELSKSLRYSYLSSVVCSEGGGRFERTRETREGWDT